VAAVPRCPHFVWRGEVMLSIFSSYDDDVP
jgi:hypothetical protein